MLDMWNRKENIFYFLIILPIGHPHMSVLQTISFSSLGQMGKNWLAQIFLAENLALTNIK